MENPELVEGLALFLAAQIHKNAQNLSYLLVKEELTAILPILKLALFFIFIVARDLCLVYRKRHFCLLPLYF